MALPLTSRIPRCLPCLCRLTPFEQSYVAPHLFKVQSRGKKKLPKSQTIPVKLLTDIKAFGRKGTILAAAPARMRNVWYPNKNARYMTLAEIKIAKQEDLIRERDLLFGKEVDQKSSAKRRQAPQVDISVTQLPPQRSFEILDRLLPPSIEFRKFKIPTGPTDKGDQTPANAIFGSVTTTDIVVNMKALLAEKAVEEGNADAAKVVLTAEDVRIRQGAAVDVETDRVKTLGDFEIEIQVKGASTVKRTLRVLDEAD